jgi:multiple sugar transport system ATP-binding protein
MEAAPSVRYLGGRRPAMARVYLEHVTKRFGEVTAVNDLTLEARDGEFLVLVGPSGCGKSTALRLIAGLEDVTAGDIYIGERRVNDIPPRDRDIAMVFQSYALYPHMSVYDNLAFGLKLRGVRKPEIRRRVQEAAAMLGIEHLLGRKPRQLSGGQRQRVAVGRAIVREPRAFLFDEPLSNLDAKLRVQTRADLIRLHQRLQTTAIYVTHDQVEAMTMGTRIAVLRDGVLQQLDTPQAVYARPANAFVAGFIGTPPMNFLRMGVTAEGEEVTLRRDSLTIPVAPQHRRALRAYHGREVIVGVRPEAIRERPADGADAVALPAQVEVIEPLGAEAYLYVSVAGAPVIARVDAATPARPNRQITLWTAPAAFHAFDPDTEENILLASG